MFETIVALATPPLRSALAIVRFSGEDSLELVSKFFTKDITNIRKNEIFHGFIIDNDVIIDEVVLLAYKAPHSFTGENSVEIICHGSPLITNKIIEVAIKNNAKMAEPGEFSSRAYLHGKMDLIQAESINDLIFAESEESKKMSILALEGKTSELIKPIKTSLGDLLSLIEVNINYPEYTDIEEASHKKVIDVCNGNITYIQKLLDNGRKGKIIKDGIKVAIVGKPNVGKSSILNALLGEEKAIVTDVKGTTRDVVEGKFNLNGIIINLYDTAGIRDSNDFIEAKGIQKSEKTIEQSDIVIAVFDSTTFDKEDERIMELIKNKKTIIVYNKKDLLKKCSQNPKSLYISALNNDIEPLKQEILKVLGIKEENYNNPSICNSRELGILENIIIDLKKALTDLEKEIPIDLVSVNIKEAYLKVLSLTGEDHDFDIANEIFSRFCLGK